MDYSQDIIDILLRAPEGLSIRKIVRHVYNAHTTLFESADLDEVKRFVTQYLTSRSKTLSSPIEHTGARGVYRLNPNSQESRHLMLDFKAFEESEEEEPEIKHTDEGIQDMFADFF